MSLDVTLFGEAVVESCECQCGHKHERTSEPELFSWRGLTHNLTHMADNAGLYRPIWRPEEEGITRAAELVPLLTKGLDKLKSQPIFFQGFAPANGWGTYGGFVEFVEAYLAACEKHPTARVHACR